MVDTNKVIDEILKSSALRQGDLGPGVTIDLRDTKDGQGYEIKIEGNFRHGGVSKADVIKILQNVFKKIDIDV